MKMTYRLLASAVLAASCACGLHAQEDTPGRAKAYMVADAHLDTQWNWDVVTTIDRYIWNTLDQNLFLLGRYPDYIFNFEGGIKYAWMKEYYPLWFEQVKKYVKEGRWHISGSSWDATDALVPSVESSIRNILLGQTFYRQEFGTESTDIFLPDCFGFGWTLPSVASHCGLIGFSSQKLDWRHKPFYESGKHPFTIGLWQGVDGSRIMLAHGYDYGRRWHDEDLSSSSYLEELASRSPLGIVYRYYGTGDMGGSPTLGSVRSVEKGVHGNGPVEVISAESDRLFKDFLPYDRHPELPVFNGELLMDVHGTGCYTSQAAMKLYNRQNENLGDAAERAALAADWLGAAEYPGDALTESWRRFIWHQFHDDLTGTSIPKAYEYSWNDELLSLSQFSDILTSATGAVASMMDTRVKGRPVVVYNQNGFRVKGIVKIDVDGEYPGYAVYDMDGKKVPSQLTVNEDGSCTLLAVADMPAVSYAVFDVRKAPAVRRHKPSSVSGIENSIYRLEFDRNGDIISLVDKRTGTETVKEGKSLGLAVFEGNRSYEWPAWEILKETLDREPVPVSDSVEVTLVENGPLRKTVLVSRKYRESEFRQYVRLYEGPYASRIDFDNEVFWQSSGALLKAVFPLSVSNPYATYDIGLGTVERACNTETAYEVYAQEWADLTGTDGRYGVTVMNDSKYGWDKPDDSTLRLTLLHTPETAGGYSYQNRQDFGLHRFSYSFTGHPGQLDRAAVSEAAAAYNRPLKAFYTSKHAGMIGREFSFASSDNPSVMIKALKKAEVSDEYVIRLYETSGRGPQTAGITFAGRILSAVSADGTEKTAGKAEFSGNRLEVEVSPYGMATYKVRLEKKTPVERHFAYADLEYDRRCFSWNAFRNAADFSAGYSYAAELLPDSVLVSGGIPFRLGEKEVENGLVCKGDTIAVPSDRTYRKAYILAASAESDQTAVFRAGDKECTAYVPYYSGFFGQWGHTGHTEGYVKDAVPAYVGTHTHSVSGDETYRFSYMFRIGVDLPEGCSELVLPDNDGIVVFAVTFSEDDAIQAVPASGLYETAVEPSGVEPAAVRTNLLSGAGIVSVSGEANGREKACYCIDGDESTKWCDISGAPNTVVIDMGEQKEVSAWKVVNAGQENPSFITADAFLQGRNSPDEEWRTLDSFTANSSNVVMREFNPSVCRYLRLMVTRSTQEDSNNACRIYELEVY